MRIITVRHHPLCVYLLCTLHHLVRLGLQAFYLRTYIHIASDQILEVGMAEAMGIT